MAQHEQIKREKTEEMEESHHKKKSQQPLYDQLKAPGESIVDLLSEPSVDRHATLLADAHSDKQRASLVIQLQQTYGNAYVQRLLNSRAMQAKLTINPPDDEYEREANRVADTIQRQEEEEEEEVIQPKATSQIQRQEEEEEEEEEEMLQAKPAGSQPSAVSEDLEMQINTARGSGQPLPESVRVPLEPQFGHDFSQVRVHTDTEADKLAQQLGAEAFTTGHDVFFKEGAYQPDSENGRGLIAHELTHVVQQEAAPALQRQATAEAEAPATEAGVDKTRVAVLKAMFEVAVVRPCRTAYEALGQEKPDVPLAYKNVKTAVEVIKSMMPPYKGVEPMYSRLIATGNALLTITNTLEAHMGIPRPLSEIRENLNPDGEVIPKYFEVIRSQF